VFHEVETSDVDHCRQTLIIVVALVLTHWRVPTAMAQVFQFTHGAVEGGQVITSSSQIQIHNSSTHAELPSSTLTVQLQPGDSDLFVLEFDAECVLFGGHFDSFSVQARLNGAVGGVLGGSLLHPQNNPTDLRVCSTGQNTISKSWVTRLSNTTSSPLTYTFSIWVRVVDIDDFINAHGILDNRIVRLTCYD
jgi:hypothetical protein